MDTKLVNNTVNQLINMNLAKDCIYIQIKVHNIQVDLTLKGLRIMVLYNQCPEGATAGIMLL